MGELHRVLQGQRSETAVELYNNCIESSLLGVACPNNILSIYLFREDSLQANPWENNPNLVLARYDFTIEELNAINWRLIYP